MRALAIILLLLFVAASATLVAFRNPGYVLIAREPFVLETSLAVFLLIAAVVFGVLYAGVRLLLRIIRVPKSLTRWRQTRRTRKAREAFQNGLTHLLTGEWLKAEQELVAGLHAADSPLLTLLGAALAAQGQGDTAKRDGYLARAHGHGGKNSLVAPLLQAQLQLLSHQNEQALASLTPLRAQHPQPAQAVRLLIETLRRLRDWQGLAQLLPEARRRALLPDNELEGLECATHAALLNLPLPAGALSTLRQAWSALPADLHLRAELVAVYARQLLRQGAADDCVRLLADALERAWDERLVLLYGEAQGTAPAAQLETAEEWQARHGDSAVLLLTLGRLARRHQLSDRALAYLEKSIALHASAEAHAELGLLFDERGDSTRALQHGRQALELCRDLHDAGAASPNRPGPGAAIACDYGY